MTDSERSSACIFHNLIVAAERLATLQPVVTWITDCYERRSADAPDQHSRPEPKSSGLRSRREKIKRLRVPRCASTGGPHRQMRTPVRRNKRGQSGSYLNLAPASAASYISPPLMIEKEAMPFS